MDHHDHEQVAGPWAGGWLVAALAAVFAAVIARSIGDVGMTPALVVAGVVFLVFAVLLGKGGVELAEGGHDDAGHHGGHGGHH